MTFYSLSHWPVIADGNSPDLVSITVPGTKKRFTAHKAYAPLAAAFLAEWHVKVHSIDYPGALGPDGWEYRVARLGGGWSNHSAGCAVDVTYDWLKADHQKHMSDVQTAAVHALLNKYVTADGRRVFGWGGDWSVGTAKDEMHIEAAQGWSPGTKGRYATPADFVAVQKRMGIRNDGTVDRSNGAPIPATGSIPAFPGKFGLGAKGAHVKAIQKGLGLPQDGVFGPATLAAVKKFQRVRPWLWPADGIVGPRTYKAIAKPV